jgi:hypothetical protein
MSGHNWQRMLGGASNQVPIAVANTTGRQANQHLAITGALQLQLLNHERPTNGIKNGGFYNHPVASYKYTITSMKSDASFAGCQRLAKLSSLQTVKTNSVSRDTPAELVTYADGLPVQFRKGAQDLDEIEHLC